MQETSGLFSYYTTLSPFRQIFFHLLHNFRQTTDYHFPINTNFVLSSEKHLSVLHGNLQPISFPHRCLQNAILRPPWMYPMRAAAVKLLSQFSCCSPLHLPQQISAAGCYGCKPVGSLTATGVAYVQLPPKRITGRPSGSSPEPLRFLIYPLHIHLLIVAKNCGEPARAGSPQSLTFPNQIPCCSLIFKAFLSQHHPNAFCRCTGGHSSSNAPVYSW